MFPLLTSDPDPPPQKQPTDPQPEDKDRTVHMLGLWKHWALITDTFSRFILL